jgi:hypothetical protein
MRIARCSRLALVSTVAALAATAGPTLASGTELAVVERATTDVVIDVGETGDTLGDMLAFGVISTTHRTATSSAATRFSASAATRG